jgi:hypothetical protein
MVAIQARWEPIIAQALQFVTECGRVKYVGAPFLKHQNCQQNCFEIFKNLIKELLNIIFKIFLCENFKFSLIY